jgi:hypothetical protein
VSGIAPELVDGEDEARAEAVRHRRGEKPLRRRSCAMPEGRRLVGDLCGMFSPKSTRNLYFSWRVIVTQIVSLMCVSIH